MKADVLLVDDDPDSREFVSRFLEKAGHSVRCAKDGHEALNALGWAVPDLIILDYRMPDMDGVSVLGVLRSYLRWTRVPVAFLTAYPNEPRLNEVRELGVEHIFVKSHFRLDELLAYVDEHVKAKQQGQPQPPGQELPSQQWHGQSRA
jgi:CheY-like chemotaxis protein